ncbi:anti-sigma factor [Algicella marina]|uniref:Anti-sigma K factor RskA C-terminal domain-containing protein n=1 Tax=Algicella marina TaxID=2683284 RepID=A0A6P1SWK6_9RHOB|nr:anti-sigma factor [Algicella marina]QHQ34828.1 hypothetical protein GO499_06250 [Algicella marina]
MSIEDEIEGDEALAAEYALGLLDGDELIEAERRYRAMPGFRADVAEWQERLAVLAEEVAPEAVAASVKRRLEERLFGAPASSGGFLSRLWLWQGATAGLAAVVAGLLLLQPAETPRYLSEIASADGELRVLVTYDAASGNITVRLREGEPVPGRALQLWAAEGQGAPVSVGVLPEGEAFVFDLPSTLNVRDEGFHFAISDEPPGGSPTGLPTGDVLAQGEPEQI